MITARNMTYAQLKLRVAERAELIEQDATTGKLVARSAEPDADRIARAIEDGVRTFHAAADWVWAQQIIEVSIDETGTIAGAIDGDASRYALPSFVESVAVADAWFTDGQYGGPVDILSFSELTRMSYCYPTETGEPRYIGAQFGHALNAGLAGSGGMELRVFPKPNRSYRVAFDARLGPVPFIDDMQTGTWPAVHDLTVAAAAVHELFKADRGAGDPAVIRAAAEFAAELQKSIDRDLKDFLPPTTGGMREAIGGARRVRLTNVPDGTVIIDKLVWS